MIDCTPEDFKRAALDVARTKDIGINGVVLSDFIPTSSLWIIQESLRRAALPSGTVPQWIKKPTPEMLEAGIAWYWKHGAISENVPKGCYFAMIAAAPQHTGGADEN